MAESEEKGREVEDPLELYGNLKFLALEDFPEIVEDAVIEKDPGSAPRNLRLFFSDDSFMDIWVSEDKYSYHWQSTDNVVRFDNAPHHDDIDTFPHHLHEEDEIKESPLEGNSEPDLKKVLKYLKKNFLEQ